MVKRKRILRVTPIDFARCPTWTIGALQLSEALGYFRWLALKMPADTRPLLNHGQGLHPFRQPPLTLGPSLNRMEADLRSRLHRLVLPTYGALDKDWRQRLGLTPAQLFTEQRLPICHWDERFSLEPRERLLATELPFAPNPLHSQARAVHRITAEPTAAGWMVRLYYGYDRELRREPHGGSNWCMQYQIRDTQLSLGQGLERVVDHVLDPANAAENEQREQSYDFPPLPILGRK